MDSSKIVLAKIVNISDPSQDTQVCEVYGKGTDTGSYVRLLRRVKVPLVLYLRRHIYLGSSR